MTDVHEPRFSPEARARALRTIEVAGVFADHTEVIVAALAETQDGHVVVGIVDETHSFTGTHHVQNEEVVERIPQLEGSGWAMVFPPGTSREDIARRTAELADINRQRIAAIDRILARRAERAADPEGP